MGGSSLFQFDAAPASPHLSRLLVQIRLQHPEHILSVPGFAPLSGHPQ